MDGERLEARRLAWESDVESRLARLEERTERILERIRRLEELLIECIKECRGAAKASVSEGESRYKLIAALLSAAFAVIALIYYLVTGSHLIPH